MLLAPSCIFVGACHRRSRRKGTEGEIGTCSRKGGRKPWASKRCIEECTPI